MRELRSEVKALGDKVDRLVESLLPDSGVFAVTGHRKTLAHHRLDLGHHAGAEAASLSLIRNKPRPYTILNGHYPGNSTERSTLHSTLPCCLYLLKRNP